MPTFDAAPTPQPIPAPTEMDLQINLTNAYQNWSPEDDYAWSEMQALIRRCFAAERDRDHYKTQMEHSAEEYEAAVRELNEALERVKELEAELERSYEQGSRMIQAAAHCMALGHFPRSVFITKEQWAESHNQVESQERTTNDA